ncbi:MAG TPA: DUF3140 domain-containing protein [Methylibium sp.]|uniref:DUF3140 domain-containing protein n=1 Tax=Methylibium sp. TaxID=2067992 RepID=UPI002DBE26ED|nr:DUF3140 domain-containing protein [Methylibium sp.]HEU4458202.1 DUF3140 domain-containing protein [Methylibium sp.]
MSGAATRDDTLAAFDEAVNMTAGEIERWLERDESKEVGWRDADGKESVGHQSGRRIVELLKTKRAELDDDDLQHMRKVVGYVKRHMAQRPAGDVRDTRWRWSLMNWGHDPLKR